MRKEKEFKEIRVMLVLFTKVNRAGPKGYALSLTSWHVVISSLNIAGRSVFEPHYPTAGYPLATEILD